jgi:hypothetical protein
MARLTYRDPQSGKIYFYTSDAEVLEKLAEYEDLEEQGMLLKLPCKIGDTVYRVMHRDRRDRSDSFIRRTILGEHNLYRIVVNGEFGKTVFLTAEEAEAAIYEKGGR